MAHHTRNSRVRGSRSADFFIRVFSLDNASLQGKIEHIHTGQVQEFRSFMEMIILIQDKLEECDFPQSAAEIRSWTANLHPYLCERGK